MPTGEMKSITARINTELYAEIKAYLEAREIAVGEFIAWRRRVSCTPKFRKRRAQHGKHENTGISSAGGKFQPVDFLSFALCDSSQSRAQGGTVQVVPRSTSATGRTIRRSVTSFPAILSNST